MEMDVLSSEERARIVRGFEAWLDGALAQEQVGEQAPPGLTSELLAALDNGDPLPALQRYASGNSAGNTAGCDLYSLWAAMTALTQEVRLQGRTFKQLHETLNQTLNESPRASMAEAGVEAVEDSPLPETSRARPLERTQQIDVLLNLRDRVERGGSTARAAAEELAPSRLPRLARWLGVGRGYALHTQEIFAALSQGYSLTLDSLDEALLAIHVSRIPCEGRLFDARRMTAIGIEETDSVPEGTVVEIYRNGYECDGEVYRPAQVKVARRAVESNRLKGDGDSKRG